MPAQPFFLTLDGDPSNQRFCLHHEPHGGSPRALVVYLHPFAEEMNKTRRMAALQARALAEAGSAVLQIDLAGCGDSSGDFGDATWSAWVDDAVRAARWLRQRHGGDAPLWFWGLRAGCLVAVDAARRLDDACNFLFWQPPAAGKAVLQQFLRLKLAGDMAVGKAVMESLRQHLAAGRAVEIAGYSLAAALAHGLEAVRLAPPDRAPDRPPERAGRVEWLELSNRTGAELLPASQGVIAAWRAAGWAVRAQVAAGPAFWQTTEIELAPDLIGATVAAIETPAAATQEAPAVASVVPA